ncbi:hypothetical protein Naga_101496g1 [Nannochloropsis gaditana]|uniref:Uncharacterized protein n=1 Tax=Nannochloropsis gaditana TaxID=72520 RepID=W7THN9_9STRA|nr:hypothetical protein Naga_101496g1 [Nannochloropsis gaditana]
MYRFYSSPRGGPQQRVARPLGGIGGGRSRGRGRRRRDETYLCAWTCLFLIAALFAAFRIMIRAHSE